MIFENVVPNVPKPWDRAGLMCAADARWRHVKAMAYRGGDVYRIDSLIAHEVSAEMDREIMTDLLKGLKDVSSND